jgi:uncharacterized protein YdhG (YjbR/CyaY superfamily)
MAPVCGEPLVLRVPRNAGTALPILRNGLAYVHDPRAMSGMQPSVDVDVVHAVPALVVARGLVRGRLMPAANVAAYIAKAPPGTRQALKALRAAIKSVAPGITERISYGIPTFDVDGRYLLYIAGFRDHVSVYPVTSGMIARYGKRIAPFRSGKGTLRFPLDEPVPIDLVVKLARVRLEERRRNPPVNYPTSSGCSSR